MMPATWVVSPPQRIGKRITEDDYDDNDVSPIRSLGCNRHVGRRSRSTLSPRRAALKWERTNSERYKQMIEAVPLALSFFVSWHCLDTRYVAKMLWKQWKIKKYIANMLQKIWEIKILTAHIQTVRISYGAPDRTRTYTSRDTRS